MNVQVRTSNAESIPLAVKELTEGILNPKLILFFASEDKFQEITLKLSEIFPDSPSMGTTTNITMNSMNYVKGGIQVTYFLEGIECAGNIIPDIKSFPLKYVQRIQDSIHSLSSPENTICLSFTTAFSNSEELVVTALDTVCSEYNIKVTGGTSGIRYEKNEKSFISMNGKVYEDCACYMCIKNTGGKIKIFKENIFIPTKLQFFVTQVDIETRTVIDLNQKPSAKVLSEALNIPPEKLKRALEEQPLGRITSNDINISYIEDILPDNTTTWGTRIYSNTKVTLLKLGDYRTITENTINKIKKELPAPSHLMLIHCDGRHKLYEESHFINEFINFYGRNFNSLSGFASHGEQTGKMHLNLTLLIIAFE